MEKIFDSHSHYTDEAFKEDYNEVLQKLKDNNVGYILNCGADYDTSFRALQQSQTQDFMYVAVGIHPHDSETATDGILGKIEELAKDPKVVAIGEAGLDYYYDTCPPKEVQKQAFIKQILLANKLNKPLIIHTRDAMNDTLDILKEYPLNSGVVHCYSGSAESCLELLKMGLYIGFTGVVTFKNARRAIESLKVVPLDRLVIETDCPYMAPEPNRGKRCDSSMLNFTAEKIAVELGLTKQEVIKHTTENAKRLYNIL